MTFQYPANPADGDIIVQPQPDGTLIKGTYDEATNTWAVGELPQEPGIPGPQGPKGDQGDQGPVGQGLNISGIVPTYDDLDTPNNHTYQFWIVDDTNTIYYSDGVAWYDLGSPIRGPQGIPGEDGADGTDGSDGAPGKGWTSTTIIDETDQSPANYQVRFNSDDGLGFVTDNLLGPPGESGVVPYATSTTGGIIKIGRGLNIRPTGHVDVGETNVDLETVPLTPEGTVYSPETYTLSYVPGYFNASDNGNWSTQGYTSGPTATQSGSITVPAQSDGAIVYFFTGSDCNNNYSPPGGDGLQWTIYAQLVSTLSLSGASWVSGMGNLGQQMVHNYSIGSEARRGSNQSSFKVGQCTWTTGTTSIGVSVSTAVIAAQRCRLNYGRCRVVFIPYRSQDLDTTTTLSNLRALYGINEDELESSDPFSPVEPPTPEEELAMNASELRLELSAALEAIDATTSQAYTSGSIYDLLRSTRQEMVDLQNLPGTFDDINNEFFRLSAIVKPYTSITFRFE